MWILPISILVVTTLLAIPLSKYLAWIMDGKYRPLPFVRWIEARLNSGPQNWKQYTASVLLFKTHPDVVAQWVKNNPSTPQPKATDLAVVFFENFSQDHPGMFPSAVTQTGADGKAQTSVQPVKEGTDVQGNFFDMWRQEHPDADLQEVPADLVTASGSGLDPHITLQNAEFQLDRVASKWADDTKRDGAEVRKEIDQLLQSNASAAFAGLAGEKFVNVLEVNLELCKRYGVPK